MRISLQILAVWAAASLIPCWVPDLAAQSVINQRYGSADASQRGSPLGGTTEFPIGAERGTAGGLLESTAVQAAEIDNPGGQTNQPRELADVLPQQTQPPATPLTHPETPAGGAPRTLTAKERIEQMLSLQTDVLSGEPISLTAAMSGDVGNSRQTDIIFAYWQLAIAVAKLHVAHQANQGSVSVATSANGIHSLETSVAESELRNAELNAVRAQHRLAHVLNWNGDRLPLPSSVPHAGSYKTRYEQIFAGRDSRRAAELNHTLPLLYELMKVRSDVLNRVSPDSAEHRQFSDAFLDTVAEYNFAIAEYALLATADTLSGRELVPLLIRVHRSDDEQVAGSRGDRRTTSVIDAPAAGVKSPLGGIRDSQVVGVTGQSASGVSAQERSILNSSPGTKIAPLSPIQAQPRLARTPSADSDGSNELRRDDQWRERNGTAP